MMVSIKICGITNENDCRILNKFLPEYAGFVFYKKSKRHISFERALLLRKKLDERIRTVSVTVDMDIEELLSLNRAVSVFQLHGNESDLYIERLKEKGFEVWKAFKMGEENIGKINESPADRVLLDTGFGTGKSFDWSLLRGIERPFILAGGLCRENVCEALKYGPGTVDVSSGVEKKESPENNFPGKDEDLVREFIKTVRSS